MLTRRHIRIKVMQSVYAFSFEKDKDTQKHKRLFEKSTANVFELYVLLLSLFKALAQHATEQAEALEKAQIKSSQKKQSHLRFLENTCLRFICEHPVLEKQIKKHKINDWHIEFKYVKKIYETLLKQTFFKDYLVQTSPSVEVDCEMVLKFFKDVIVPADFLNTYFEEKQLSWQDDLPLVNTFILKQLKKITLGRFESFKIPQLSDVSEEIDFGRTLLQKVVAHNDLLQAEIEGRTPNWDTERIAKVDAIVLKIAIAELLYFPNIPPKVTINEYLEIAKEYSTAKSSTFINGVLDKLVQEFQATQRLNKKGRGLL